MTLRNVRNMRQEALDLGTQSGLNFGGQAGMDYTPPDADWYRAEQAAAAGRRAAREEAERVQRAAEAKRQADKERAERQAREDAERKSRERADERRRQRESTSAPDPYTVLGIGQDATRQEIRAAWARLCKQHHPDIGGDADKLKAVNRAYEALKGKQA